MLCRNLAEIRIDQVTSFGGKAARLGEALALGCPVLPGIVLSTDLFRRAMRQGALQGEIATILRTMQPTALAQFQAVEWAIRSAFAVRKLPQEVSEMIRSCWREMGGVPLAVRSSATWEDSPEHSFVGQHESFMFVRDEEALTRAVLGCWVSLYSAKALAYAQRFGVDLANASMAVLLQPMIDISTQGALYNVDPISGSPDVFVLQVEQGPEAGLYRLDPYDRSPGESPHWSALRRYGLLLGEHHLCYQAIEWAVSGDTLYLLRVRPVTRVPGYLPHWPLYSDTEAGPLQLQRPSHIGARALRPYSHYDRNLAPARNSAAFRDASRLFSPYAGREEFFVCGYLYSRMRRFPLQSTGRKSSRLQRGLQSLRRVRAAQKLDRGFWEHWRASQPRLNHLQALPLASTPDEDLASALAEAIRTEEAFWVRHGQLGDSDKALVNLLCALYRRWHDSPADTRCQQLARALSDPMAQAHVELCSLAQANYPDDDAREATFQRFLNEHRHHFVRGDPIRDGSGVRDLEESPQDARQLFDQFTDPAQAADFCSQRARQERRIQEMEAEALVGLGRLRRQIFAQVLGMARRYAPTRRTCELTILASQLAQQRIVIEIGRRMVANGLLAEPEEAFHLTHVQLLDWLGGREVRNALVRTLLEEKALERRWWRYSPPDTIGGEAAPAASPREYSVDARLSGLPISPGVATGRARLINTLGEATNIVPGEVLLCHKPLFEITPLFDMASAVVTETGNLLDHAGVLAREYGIPAVFGVRGLTAQIKNGDELRVDADRGLVERIQPEIDWGEFE